MITVIEQTTAEREAETMEIYNNVKPLLEKGYTLTKAIRTHYKINNYNFTNKRWFKDLQKKCKADGYKARG